MTALRHLRVIMFGVAALALASVGASAAVHRHAASSAAAPAGAAGGPGAGQSGGPIAPPGFETRIAAVVNDQIISVFDLASRIKMVTASSNLPDTPETRKRILPEVLRTLVDEKLQMQEAKKENVKATAEEVTAALAQIAKQNHMDPSQLDGYLKANGIDRDALVEQLKASIVWAKLVRKKAAETISISDDEIDDALRRTKEHEKDPESRVAEIFLAVDNPTQDARVRAQAERLTEEMKKGARFSAIAQQYSQSSTAAVGGDLGWIRPDQLAPALGKIVQGLQVGQLSQPIRTAAGYYLMLVLDRRTGTTGSGQDTVLDIVQVVFPLPNDATDAVKRAALVEAQGIRAQAAGCPEFLKIGKEKAPQLSSEGKIHLSQISPQMRSLVTSLTVGKPSEPILQKNGVGVIMVCSKSDTTTAAPTRDEVVNSLLRQRLDMVSRQYMRDLRRNAFVDVRLVSQ